MKSRAAYVHGVVRVEIPVTAYCTGEDMDAEAEGCFSLEGALLEQFDLLKLGGKYNDCTAEVEFVEYTDDE